MTDIETAIDSAPFRVFDNSSFPVWLEFSPEISPVVRARISYAFRVFAATYGHPVSDCSGAPPVRCCYGRLNRTSGNSFHIPSLYPEANPTAANHRKFLQVRYADENIPLSLGLDSASGKPDWLGELFQWLSSSYESGPGLRDDVGRIPYSETVFARSNLSPRKPHAAALMAWFENSLTQRGAAEGLPKAPSPIPDARHLVVSSHDIDFYFSSRASAAKRVIKNMMLAFPVYRSFSYFTDNLEMLLSLLGGKRVGDFLPSLVDKLEREGIRSTLFAVARHGHRRDPDYTLEQLRPQLQAASLRGFPSGLHGSYRSIIEDRSLPKEAELFRTLLGEGPSANRQHWLRFDEHQKLFAQLKLAAIETDSTLGFPDQIGFRNGASFAFPPYDFANERPHEFLEIPLAIMDGNLAACSRSLRRDPQELAEEVLGASRKYGWGGISVLWHNPMEPLSVPTAINQVFWNCARHRDFHKECWMSADQFLAACLPRYQQAGLLVGVTLRG